MNKPVRISAAGSDDLGVVSALLQDATIKVGDLSYLKKVRRFAAVMNRFLWEAGEGRRKKPMRVRTGLRIESVLSAAYRNIPFSDPDHVLELLSIEASELTSGNFEICLAFSGYASIRLEAEVIDVFIEDLSRAWRAVSRPCHPLD